MKGPSLDAIRKFKEQQERKKREEDERRIQEKLCTLEHRAAQGDRKAKTELKKIEKLKEDRSKIPDPQPKDKLPRPTNSINADKKQQGQLPKDNGTQKKPKSALPDFEELMRLAKQNTNQVLKKPEPPKPEPPKPKAKCLVLKRREVDTPRSERPGSINVSQPLPVKPRPEIDAGRPKGPPTAIRPKPKFEMQHRPAVTAHASSSYARRPQIPIGYRSRYEEEYDDEDDDYESDGFVVDEEDEETGAEVSKTIRSLFRYDKRRCDLREQELDRQYRAIGRVSTFEDLEREERRASRLAAAEDAKAFKEEEERKRLKKARLKKT